jgi:hypothetical protein
MIWRSREQRPKGYTYHEVIAPHRVNTALIGRYFVSGGKGAVEWSLGDGRCVWVGLGSRDETWIVLVERFGRLGWGWLLRGPSLRSG